LNSHNISKDLVCKANKPLRWMDSMANKSVNYTKQNENPQSKNIFKYGFLFHILNIHIDINIL